MAIGLEVQIGAVKETTYGTRAAPTRFFEVAPGESVGFTRNYYVSAGLGGGMWRRRRVQTTRVGSGTLPMEVPTVGFGFWLDLMHGNTVTPVQQAATTAYLQTHTLDKAPTKSATIQIGRPMTAGGIQPFDYLGCMVSGGEFAWDPAGVVMFTPTIVAHDEKTDQSLATLTPPTSTDLFSFKGGKVTIAGSPVADIIGGGSAAVAWPLRDDAYALGSNGTIMKPMPSDRPTATGTLTADFTDMTHYSRVVAGTIADVVLTFEGATIASTYKETIQITIPDCGFTGDPPQVGGPGPVSQTIAFQSASAAANAPVITYISTDTTV